MKAQCVKHLLELKSDPFWSDWRWQLRESARNPEDLLSMLPELIGPVFTGGSSDLKNMSDVADAFRFAATPYYLSLIRLDDPLDPILRQIVPDIREIGDDQFTDPDPLHEEVHSPIPGLIHRYPDRVLLYTTERCAVYCRFCTRKRKLDPGYRAPFERERILDYIRSHREVVEVILSGGDPLSLSDSAIEELLGSIREIDHVLSIRIHTRIPVVLPMRINEKLVEIFSKLYPVTIVTHFNHANEITADAAASIERMKRSGITVLNQTVLLRGVNDSVEAMRRLLLALLRIGIKPYYLHQCDEVKGVSHFSVPVERGEEILRALRGAIPGIAMPLYVIDLPGGGGKIPVCEMRTNTPLDH
jgi:lysine 2,3-aminomutase